MDTQRLSEIGEGKTKKIDQLFSFDLNKYSSKKAFKESGGRILNAPVLFVNWSALNEKRCPYCHNKLKINLGGTIYRCNGAKHKKKPFAIKADNPALK